MPKCHFVSISKKGDNDMKRTILFLCFVISVIITYSQSHTVTGRVTDYNGQTIDSCSVIIYNPDFSEAFEVLSNSEGYYRIDSVPQGRYAAIAAMRVSEYPRVMQVPFNKMKLEFWAWNVILNQDLNLDIRYDKLELYGTEAFFEYGGRQELLIYARPMSVTKVVRDPNFMDKTAQEKNTNVTVAPEFMDFKVYIDGIPTDVLSVQHLSLPNTNGNSINDDCYLIQTAIPNAIYSHFEKPYEVRVVGHNKEFDEWGESVYYLEVPQYNSVK